VNVFTKRNAAVGYVTLKAARRMLGRRRRRRSALRLSAYVALGLVSAGILAGLVALLVRRSHAQAEGEEPAAEAEAGAEAEGESEIVGEYVTTPEPIPAT